MPIPLETAAATVAALRTAMDAIAAIPEPHQASVADVTPSYVLEELAGLIDCIQRDAEVLPVMSDVDEAYDRVRQRCDRESALRREEKAA